MTSDGLCGRVAAEIRDHLWLVHAALHDTHARGIRGPTSAVSEWASAPSALPCLRPCHLTYLLQLSYGPRKITEHNKKWQI